MQDVVIFLLIIVAVLYLLYTNQNTEAFSPPAKNISKATKKQEPKKQEPKKQEPKKQEPKNQEQDDSSNATYPAQVDEVCQSAVETPYSVYTVKSNVPQPYGSPLPFEKPKTNFTNQMLKTIGSRDDEGHPTCDKGCRCRAIALSLQQAIDSDYIKEGQAMKVWNETFKELCN